MGTRKTVQLMVILTILAWATQTLYKQWGFGGVMLPQGPARVETASAGAETLVAPAAEPTLLPSSEVAPAAAPAVAQTLAPAVGQRSPPTPVAEPMASATLELRDRAEAVGGQVTLRDACRWSRQDDAIISPFAGTVLLRMVEVPGVRKLTVEDVRAALHDEGLNVAALRFSGAAACAVTQGNVDPAEILREMRAEEETLVGDTKSLVLDPKTPAVPDAKTQPAAAPPPAPVPARAAQPARPGPDVIAGAPLPPAPAAVAQPPAPAPQPLVADVPQTQLRDVLVNDLLARLKLAKEDAKIEFDPRDNLYLSLTSPRCTFTIDSSRAAQLGPIAWDVSVKTDTSENTITVTANLSAWEDQLVLTRSLSPGQAILKNDLAPRRVLVETLAAAKVTDAQQAVGSVAARALKRGEVLTTDAIASPPVVRAGDFVTVSLKIGPTSVETVARALDTGSKGAAIRARNEATGQVYDVTLTGPGTGKVAPSPAPQQDVAAINPGS
jgi:flagella basal body P-ring formation protein FlgA